MRRSGTLSSSPSASSRRRDAFLVGLLLSSLEGERKARLTAVSHDVPPFLPMMAGGVGEGHRRAGIRAAARAERREPGRWAVAGGSTANGNGQRALLVGWGVVLLQARGAAEVHHHG